MQQNYENIDKMWLDNSTIVKIRHKKDTGEYYVVTFKNYKVDEQDFSELQELSIFTSMDEALDKFCRLCGFEEDLPPAYVYKHCISSIEKKLTSATFSVK